MGKIMAYQLERRTIYLGISIQDTQFFFSFVIGGIYIRFYDEFDYWLIILFAIPVVICYIPAYKAVFTKDKYLKYFKQFEKRDDSWHNKWKWITIAFCIGSVVVSLLGICVALGILFFNK